MAQIDKLNLHFDPNEILTAQKINKIPTKVDEIIDKKSDIDHNHSGVYATETELSAGLSTKANTVHEHSQYDTIVDVNSKLENKADKSHNHDTFIEKVLVDTINVFIPQKKCSGICSLIKTNISYSILLNDIQWEGWPDTISYDANNNNLYKDIVLFFTKLHASGNISETENCNTISYNGNIYTWNSLRASYVKSGSSALLQDDLCANSYSETMNNGSYSCNLSIVGIQNSTFYFNVLISNWAGSWN